VGWEYVKNSCESIFAPLVIESGMKPREPQAKPLKGLRKPLKGPPSMQKQRGKLKRKKTRGRWQTDAG
jgi:hypothetical protein